MSVWIEIISFNNFLGIFTVALYMIQHEIVYTPWGKLSVKAIYEIHTKQTLELRESKVNPSAVHHVSSSLDITSFFDIYKANVVRTRSTITAIVLSVFDQSIFAAEDLEYAEQEMTLFLQHEIRQTDLVFKLGVPFEWCIILAHSGEKEAEAFLERLQSRVQLKVIPLFNQYDAAFLASIAEIGNSDVELEDLIEHGRNALVHANKEWQIVYVNHYKAKHLETVKISILEEDEIFRNVLKNSLEGLSLKHFEIEIETFSDGYLFLQSKRYLSSHTHLVIMNDILPRKNGLEVLYTLRNLPNNKKIIIYMMTKRKTEEDMIYAYEHGVDQYVMKPFHLRLFEAQIKRTFERLWS
ncbi:response regulator [Siminovitchia thermophila]|uniref:response regulator n=1 Tax=Siminovitchia thermophila TaxID=1245522 RepID=UPI0019655E5D|nr:response regulator [Siminovitchia thermophila]